MPNYKTTLETERLILRSPTPDDFEAFHSWGSNHENVRYMAWGPNNEEETKAFMAGVKPGKDFAVVIRDTDAVIGSCGIYPKGHNDRYDTGYMGELGWILHKDYWKRGYGTELGKELVRYGFEDLKLGRIFAPCAAVNYGSYRVMERIGMKREALHRKAFWARVDKEWIDELWYAILAEDYFAEKSPLIGKTASVTATVTEDNTAKAVGSGSLDVFATPMMIALMEKAACECIADSLKGNQTSVGTQITAVHTAASPSGMKITATAVVESVSGKKIEFTVTASDETGEIGKGEHTRVIVDEERFMSKVGTRK